MSEDNKVKAVKIVKVKATSSSKKPETPKSVAPKQIIKEPVEQALPSKQKAVQNQKPVQQMPVAVNTTSQQKVTAKQPGVKTPVSQNTVAPKPTITNQQSRYEKQPAKTNVPVEKKQSSPVYNKWWFWLALAAIVLATVALLTYGGNDTSSDASSNSAVVSQNADANEGADESGGSLSVDENLLTVEVTMPATFFEDETPEEIQASAKEAGFLSCTVNSDGSVTYKMTKGKRAEVLRNYKKEIDSTIQEYTSGGENAPQSFKSITYNDKVTQFDVRVDRAAYENSWFDSLYAMGFYMFGGYYQILNGVPNDQVDVIVNFIDDATGEVIESGSYQEALANSNS